MIETVTISIDIAREDLAAFAAHIRQIHAGKACPHCKPGGPITECPLKWICADLREAVQEADEEKRGAATKGEGR